MSSSFVQLCDRAGVFNLKYLYLLWIWGTKRQSGGIRFILQMSKILNLGTKSLSGTDNDDFNGLAKVLRVHRD